MSSLSLKFLAKFHIVSTQHMDRRVFMFSLHALSSVSFFRLLPLNTLLVLVKLAINLHQKNVRVKS